MKIEVINDEIYVNLPELLKMCNVSLKMTDTDYDNALNGKDFDVTICPPREDGGFLLVEVAAA